MILFAFVFGAIVATPVALAFGDTAGVVALFVFALLYITARVYGQAEDRR